MKTISYIELCQKIKNKEIKNNQKIWLSYGGRMCTYSDGCIIDDYTHNEIYEEHDLESLLEDNCRFAIEDLDKLVRII